MKTKFFFYLALLAGFVLLSSLSFSQEKMMSKSEPVPGAEITVEQVPGPTIIKSKLTTNDKGEFTLVVIPDQFKKLPDEFKLKFTIKPKDQNKFPAENNFVVVDVKKSDGPNFKFYLTFKKSTEKSNKGVFIVNGKAQT
ncbi:carboxypeptidase regulatory-like domain-containing protein [Bacteroidetes/Chlorobi group bacterium ChocPot_Mid]|nr:MAG: carboxypeptidase regulatory-like domain-containing protein [Bacteroidetes/Chlorobi group bacterium ChocPot_Mid]